ncbi:MAG: sporulation protein YqfD, partial [Firmicutes bacterium]|nr:sporulation protein YqfD [Bacillota bacterium]
MIHKWQKTRLQVKGLNQLRLINFLKSEGLVFFELYFLDNANLQLTVHNKNLVKLKAILERYQYEYKVVFVDLARFCIQCIKRRIGALVGCVFFLSVILSSNLFVWDIKIGGLDKVPQNMVQNILKQNGVHKGMLASRVKQNEIKKQMMSLESVVDTTLHMQGTTLRVQVFEDLFG